MPPQAPNNITATEIVDTESVVFWELSDHTDTSIIVQRAYQDNGVPGVWEQIATLPSASNIFKDEGLYPNTTYYYRVISRNDDGDSDPSDAVSITTAAGTAASMEITDLDIVVDNPWQTTISCTAPTPTASNAKIAIERRIVGAETFRPLKAKSMTALTAFSFIDYTVNPDTAYEYRARVLTSASYGPYTEAVPVTTPPKTSGLPNPPNSLSVVTYSDSSALVQWEDTNDNTATYKIETSPVPMDIDGNLTWTQIGISSIGATSFEIDLVNPQIAKLVRVRANNENGDSGYRDIDDHGGKLYAISSSTVKETPQTYHIGPSQIYTSIAGFSESVGWDSLGPGDIVYIHPNEDEFGDVIPYYEKLMLVVRGTAESPVRIVGVPKSDQYPIIDGTDATTAAEFSHGYIEWASFGLLFIGTHTTNSDGYRPGYLKIENLELRNAYAGNYGSQTNTFSDHNNDIRTWSPAASGIYIQKGDHITIDGCDIHANGNGIFGSGNDEQDRVVKNLTISKNYIYGNGTAGTSNNDRQHGTYIESEGVVYEFNHYGPNRKDSESVVVGGALLKDRSSGCIIRNNWFHGGALRFLDLVEAQSLFRSFFSLPSYRTTKVFGNIFINGPDTPAATTPIHYGGDDGSTWHYRKGICHFFHNTCLSHLDQSQKWRVIWFNASSLGEIFEVKNNIIGTFPATTSTAPELAIIRFENYGTFGNNWMSPQWLASSSGQTWSGIAFGIESNTITTTGNDAGFIDFENYNLELTSISDCLGQSGRLPADTTPVEYEYVKHQSFENRSSYGLGADLGAFEGDPDTSPPIVESISINDSGTRLTISFNEMVTGTTPPVLSVNGDQVTATYYSGHGTNSIVYSLSRTVMIDEVITATYTPGDIQDYSGNQLSEYNNLSVSNNSNINEGGEAPIQAPTFQIIGTVSQDSPLNTVTIPVIDSLSQSDVLLATIILESKMVITPPSGWTLIATVFDAFDNSQLSSFWTKIDSNNVEATSFTWNLNTARIAAGSIYKFQGHDADNPINTSQSASYPSSMSPISPSVTTNVDNCLLMRFMGIDTSFTATVPDGHILSDHVSDGNSNAVFFLATKSLTSLGETGDAAWTISSTRGTSHIAIAIAPAKDETAPEVESATIDSTGLILTIEFSEIVTGDQGFTLSGDHLITYTSGSGTDTLAFSIDPVVYSGESFTLSYSAGNIEDAAENALATLSEFAVTNNSTAVEDETVPEVESATIDSTGLVLTIGFSEPVTGNQGFELDGGYELAYTSGSGTNTLTFLIEPVVYAGELRTLSYSVGNFEDASGNALATFSGFGVTNNSSEISPKPIFSFDVASGATSNLGSSTVGTDVTKSFTITNSGSENLVLGTMVIVGTGWEITTDPSDETVIPDGETTIAIKGVFDTVGVKTAVLTMPSNDTDSPYVVNISVTIVSGDVDETVDLQRALYRVDLKGDKSRSVTLVDEHGISRTYQDGDEFRGCEYFDQYTTGNNPYLVKKTDSIENEYFYIDLTAGLPTPVLLSDKLWKLTNVSTSVVDCTVGSTSFKLLPRSSTPFFLTGDLMLESNSSAVVSVYVKKC